MRECISICSSDDESVIENEEIIEITNNQFKKMVNDLQELFLKVMDDLAIIEKSKKVSGDE
ncbi:hypothetical protein [Acidianus bottle-shaped virus 2 strain ABV2]|uniref:Uncharacterized protein n=1 Tax=Acidianus bottle-shaped virus 2 strain ABV2 TaxID=1732173 RepID=A0A0N9P4F7_9VIRU|nr:hypothetical protein AVU01_gp17 [Acidianus bottle-shaped virus 2 strain ABV2]ALG96765.1 hypothetical protein [Acidianus bottle-shaped virus 2 strain ABV2]